MRARIAAVRVEVDRVRDDALVGFQQAAGFRRKEVRAASDLVHRPRRVRTAAAVLVGRPDHVMKDVSSADGRAAGAVLAARHVVDFANLQRGHVAVFGQPRRHALDFAPPVGGVALHEDFLRRHHQIRCANRPRVPIVELPRRRHVLRIALRRAVVRPLGDLGELGLAQRRVVLVLLDADVLFDVPGRHDAGVGADAGALLDRARPRPDLVVRDQRHRRHTVRVVAVLAAALENRRDVAGEGHVCGRCAQCRPRRQTCRRRQYHHRADADRPADMSSLHNVLLRGHTNSTTQRGLRS